jgi:hypothetical protein
MAFAPCYFFAISPATRYLIKEAISFAAREPTGHQAVEKRFFLGFAGVARRRFGR